MAESIPGKAVTSAIEAAASAAADLSGCTRRTGGRRRWTIPWARSCGSIEARLAYLQSMGQQAEMSVPAQCRPRLHCGMYCSARQGLQYSVNDTQETYGSQPGGAKQDCFAVCIAQQDRAYNTASITSALRVQISLMVSMAAACPHAHTHLPMLWRRCKSAAAPSQGYSNMFLV